MNILDYIPFGQENAISRSELSEKTGLSDRIVRKHIQKERTNGTFIFNFQDGEGYFQSTDTENLLRQFKLNRSRAMSILKQQSPIYKELKERGVYEDWTIHSMEK